MEALKKNEAFYGDADILGKTYATGYEPIRDAAKTVGHSDGVRLIYRQRRDTDNWQDVNEFVPFVVTDTPFGGQRQWFRCLSCGCRCRILYGGARFRCRRCYKLKYESQYEATYARACSQAHNLRKRLGQVGSLDDPFPPKPKGMLLPLPRRVSRSQLCDQAPQQSSAPCGRDHRRRPALRHGRRSTSVSRRYRRSRLLRNALQPTSVPSDRCRSGRSRRLLPRSAARRLWCKHDQRRKQ